MDLKTIRHRTGLKCPCHEHLREVREAWLAPSLQGQVLRLGEIKFIVHMFIAGKEAEAGIESKLA